MTTPRHLVLASGSPRRRELLSSLGFELEVIVPHVDERWPGGAVDDAVLAICEQKLHAVSAPGLTLAADTVVVLDEVPLGKPESEAHARQMLEQLSGRAHRVVTGFCLRQGGVVRRRVVSTKVSFRALSAVEIERYLETQEPMDKAGAYGIQGLGGALVDRVEGSYTNVVGLPLREVLEEIGALTGAAS